MFDPTKITTFITLAAAAIWAVCYVRNSRKVVVFAVLVATLAALVTTAVLEFSQHINPCANTPKLLLNEICAEGKECDGGKDFIEIYNPSSTSVSLACYAVGDQRSVRDGSTRIDAVPHILPGDIGAHSVRAWNEDQLGFRISWKKKDRVALYRLRLFPGKHLDFDLIEQALIGESKSYQYRSPDGTGELKFLRHEDVIKEKKEIGSFEKLNTQ